VTWRIGDTGHTSGGIPYRIIADDAKGPRGNIVALLAIEPGENVVRYTPDGIHGGVPKVYNLEPPKVRA